MKENFEKSLLLTVSKEIEGGFTNDPLDKGGPTNLGITMQTLSEYYEKYGYGDFDGDGDIDITDVKLLDTPEEAAPIYKTIFWDRIRGDELPAGVDYFMFDSSVNHGPCNAGKFLQRAINKLKGNLVVDGSIGNLTLKSVMVRNPEVLLIELARERETFYFKIVAKYPAQERFIKGWMNRLHKVVDNARQFL